LNSTHAEKIFRLSTIEEALRFLERTAQSDDSPLKLQFDGELKTLSIEIEGPGFHGELTGEVARGLVEFQDEIYRSLRFALSGTDGKDIRLTAQQKELVELQIDVKPGCTLINFDLGKLSDGIIATLNTMNPNELQTLVVSVVALLAFGWVGKTWVIEHFKSKTTTSEDQAETDRLKVAIDGNVQIAEKFAAIAQGDKRVERFAEAGALGMREIAVRATGASSVKMGRLDLDEDELANMRRRAPRTTGEQISETDKFRILAIDGTSSPFKLTISGAAIPGEFTIEFDETEFDAKQSEAVWTAFRTRECIELTVKAVQIRGKIKGAVLIEIGVR
jgi:hypothetical protein